MHARIESSSFNNLAEVQRNRRTFALEDTLISVDTFVSIHVKLMHFYLLRLFFNFVFYLKIFQLYPLSTCPASAATTSVQSKL